jgi:hypothetical protein
MAGAPSLGATTPRNGTTKGEFLSLEGLKNSVPELEEDELRARVLATFGSLAGLASGSASHVSQALGNGLITRLVAAAQGRPWLDRLPPP